VPGSYSVCFDAGSFDNWCVYLQRQGQARYAPSDAEYFARLQQLAATHGHQKIYTDFTACYQLTTARIDAKVLALIEHLSTSYGPDANELEMWLTVLYAGMVAEENKARAILKKRIKRLGMHQVLLEQMPPAEAARFSRGKPWQQLDALMKQRGF
jgi:hypothetical protein